MVPAKVMGSESVRQSWRSVIDAVAGGEDVVVNRHAKPAIAMIAYEDYQALLEELEDLRAARQAAAVRDAIRHGKMDTVPWEQVKKELRAEVYWMTDGARYTVDADKNPGTLTMLETGNGRPQAVFFDLYESIIETNN